MGDCKERDKENLRIHFKVKVNEGESHKRNEQRNVDYITIKG